MGQNVRVFYINIGKWIKTIYEILVNGLKSGKWGLDEEKANKAINFIENFCHHSEGRNDLLKLELWQKAIVSAIFGIMDKRTGYRQFREVFIVVARKNGKTLFAAAIAAYMAYIDGEYGAKVYFLAPKLDQADLVYDAFYQIVQADDELDSITKKRRSDIYIKEFNTSVKKIAFNSKKSDGFNPQMVVNDEMEAWQGDQGLKQYEVMTSALGARKQPLILSISTAGYINDGIYDELMRRSTSFLKGNSKETRILPFLYMIDNIEAWDDLEELKKSNPNLGVSVSEEFYIEQIEIAKASLSKKVEFLTQYCNIKQNSSVAWLDYWDVMKAVNEDLRLTLEQFRGCYCVGGIDLSRTTDLTAASIVIWKNGKWNVITKFYINSCLSTIEGVVNKFIGMINGVIDVINEIPGVSLGKIGRISLPRLAKGGVLKEGTAMVAEAGPELLSMVNGKAVVTPLSGSAKNQAMENAEKGGGGYVQNVNITSPKALSPYEIARQTRLQTRSMILAVQRG